jgi:hypothetical protein
LKEFFMLKKGLIFGSIALFLTALIILTGCPTSADDDTGGQSGDVSSGGGNTYYLIGSVTTDQVQTAVDEAVLAKGSITFRGNVVITNSGGINFKNVPVTIENKVRASGVSVNVSIGETTVSGGGTFDFDADDLFVSKEADFNKVTGLGSERKIRYLGPDAGSLPPVVEDDTSAWLEVPERVAIGTYTVGESTESDVPTGYTVYVVEKISVPEDLTVPTGGVILAFGAVEFSGDSVSLKSFEHFDFLHSATIINANPDPETVFTLNLPDTSNSSLRIKAIQLGAGGVRLPADRLPGGLTAAIIGKDKALNLPIPAAFGTYKSLNITGGDGNIEFTPATGVTGLALKTAKLNTSGKITFNNVDIERKAVGDWSFGGDVYFRKTYTAGGGGGGAGDNHTAVTITLTAAGETTGGDFTLAAGKSIYFSSSRTQNAPKLVLQAGEDAPLVMTPAATAVLTGDYDLAPNLTLSDEDLTIERGSLVVPPNASFSVDGAIAITLKNDAAKIVIGDTVISGRPNFSGKMAGAAGGGFTLSQNRLSGGKIEGSGYLLITLDPSHAGAKTLTLSALELDLGTADDSGDVQALVIGHAGGNTIANKVVLKGEVDGGDPGKITIDSSLSAVNDFETIRTAIVGTTTVVKATISGIGISKLSSTAGYEDEPVGSIAGGAAAPANDATITGYTNNTDFTINSTTEFGS